MKKIILFIGILAALAAAGYFGYQLYEAAVQDATKRIKAGVTQGVGEGISKGIGNTLNPFKI